MDYKSNIIRISGWLFPFIVAASGWLSPIILVLNVVAEVIGLW